MFVLLLMVFVESSGQIGGVPGAFARMGYHARGIAMGNALTALNQGEIHAYYNPALTPFAAERTASASFGIMSLDRYINFLDYVQAAKPTAGISAGLINAGVRNIDGRDRDGIHTEDYSTTENQFFLNFANRFDERVSLGVTIKLYYSKLFDQVSSTTVGFDAGALVLVTDELTLGFVVQDIGSKYNWDTAPLYGQSGTQTKDKFPILYRLGSSYKLPGYGTITLDIESSSEKTTIIRFGGEYEVHEYFLLRGGVDRWNLKDNTAGVKPAFGFGLRKPFDGWTPLLDYAYVFEPFSPSGIHIISLAVKF